jgi:mRNA interferase MazF
MARILRVDIVWAVLQIRTLSIERLGQKIGRASAEELNLIIDGLNEIMGA